MATTVIWDNFDRPDSATVGDAIIGGTWAEFTGGSGVAEISSNKLRLRDNTAGNGAGVSLQHGPYYNFSLSLWLDTSDMSTRGFYICVNAAASGAAGGIMVMVPSTNAANNTVLSPKWADNLVLGQINWTVPRYVWLECSGDSSNITVSLYTNTTSSKPALPDLTASGAPGTGGYFELMADQNAVGQSALVDDCLLVENTSRSSSPLPNATLYL
jgi:hypothetical protein